MEKRRIGNICLALLLVVAIGVGIFQHSGINWNSIFHDDGEKPLFGTVSPVTKVVINDLSKAFDIILNNGSKEFHQSYPIDDSFLHWVSHQFGEAVVMDIAYRVYEGYVDKDLWYAYTGNSMHVLWLMYCKELGYATYQLENVHWKECASKEVVTIDLTGDINLADDWHTMLAAEKKQNGIYDCISEAVTKE